MAGTGAYEIHSEARGSHWIAWVSRDGDPQPHRSVVLVGQTQDEAVTRARQWAENGQQIGLMAKGKGQRAR